MAGCWAKMVARCISETPLPTNTLFPRKGLVHPRVQRPSTSENTDTASPGFMTDRGTTLFTLDLLDTRTLLSLINRGPALGVLEEVSRQKEEEELGRAGGREWEELEGRWDGKWEELEEFRNRRRVELRGI